MSIGGIDWQRSVPLAGTGTFLAKFRCAAMSRE